MHMSATASLRVQAGVVTGLPEWFLLSDIGRGATLFAVQ